MKPVPTGVAPVVVAPEPAVPLEPEFIPAEPPAKTPAKPSSATPAETTTAPHVAATEPHAVLPETPAVEPTPPLEANVPEASSAATLNFTSLVERLRATKAIGVLTKLSIRNQSDDLVEKFRAYHKRQGTASLEELHTVYDGLILKLLALLQDGDPPLARDIDRSRGAIWDILADPRKFIESNLTAVAAP